ncbi:alpha/beta hydrolase [Frankia sp. CNm7]|uniref:Alpha/beta hydrolase n=1 Tax=Frankia nepalensis TaxID=1836974 RepID=A0A937RM54_9ACTN|nr:alpha/beta hydrolase [Frankia nepalensis]MBL7498362.1 alpha/beta hydrolase [Frankia nepalensis]MBL7513229.1 alpha/beta hydrolase [Frankia nepalensis]MBL7524060.1 alpha/beta hydrolase [Frankia nepalensis]MBL7628913.1 alpha/beta hydrolase [Frankia nepalensis]
MRGGRRGGTVSRAWSGRARLLAGGLALAGAVAGCSGKDAGAGPATAPTGDGVAVGERDPNGDAGIPANDPAGMRRDLDLAYGTGSSARRLDLYRPASTPAGGLPLVVVIHGGAFQYGDKRDMAVHVRALVARGYAVASLNYRMAPAATFPAAVVDVKGAVRWLRANADRYGLDPDRFAALGESAGAYLATMLGVSADRSFPEDAELGNTDVPSAVRAVVHLYGPVSFLTMDDEVRANPACKPGDASHDAAGSPESLFLGRQITTAPGLVAAANPVTYLDRDRALPRFLVEHGRVDCTVPYQQSAGLADALRAAGATVSLNLLDGRGHSDTFPLAERYPGILAFLADALR